MPFNTQNAIIAQNAASAAAVLVAAEIAASRLDSSQVMEAFEHYRTSIFEGSISLAGAESAADVPAGGSRGGGRSYGGGRSSNGGGSNGNADPATLVINMGKYKGKTIEAVYADDPDYLDWLAANSNNDFLRGKAQAFLASVE